MVTKGKLARSSSLACNSLDSCSESKLCPFSSGEKKLIVIVTDHWFRSWFTELLLPASRYAHLQEQDIEWFDLRDGTWEQNFERLRELLLTHGGKARCFPCSDPPMDLFCAVCESLRDELDLTGASFLSFWLATNKLATRKAIAGGDGLKCEGVYADMVNLPDLGVDGFFKPVVGCGSKGVFHCKTGDIIANPLKGLTAGSSSSDIVQKLAASYEVTHPFLDNKLVGLVEEYVNPEGRHILAFDGFVHNGKIYHYCICDNVYLEEDPEDFDRMVIPSQVAPEGSPAALAGWKLFDEVVGDLVKKGLDNQFVDLETFLLPDGRVVMMELNCRTDCNPSPLFGRVYGADNDCFSTAIDLLSGEAPAKMYSQPDNQGRVGIALYRAEVTGAPEFESSEDGKCLFYNAPGYWSHVFVVGTEGEMALREMAISFYEKMVTKGKLARSSSLACNSLDSCSESKLCPFSSGEKKLIVIVTDHWFRSWFTELLLPASRYAHLQEQDIEWFDLRDGTWDQNFERLRELLLKHGGKARCFPCSDPPMDLYCAVCESLRDELDLTGASFISFWLATNKLATRKAIAGGDGLKCEGVYADMENLPDLGVDGFFKPVAGCGSKGVFHCKTGDIIANPLKGLTAGSSSSDIVQKLAASYEVTHPFLDNKLVGLVEEYVKPEGRHILAFDGFVHNGKIYHYCICDNVYLEEDPEDFDRMVVPSQVAPEGSPAAIAGWTLFDEVVGDLVKKGLDNQFVDLETFLLPDGKVVMMELNCRTDCNPSPLFGRVYGADNDCFSTAIDLLSGEAPSQMYSQPDNQGRVGIALYRPEVKGAPEFESSEDGKCFFYNAPGYWSHVFVVGTESEMALREIAISFYEKMSSRDTLR